MPQPTFQEFQARYPAKRYPEFAVSSGENANDGTLTVPMVNAELLTGWKLVQRLLPPMDEDLAEAAAIHAAAHLLSTERQQATHSQTYGAETAAETQARPVPTLGDPFGTTVYGRAYQALTRGHRMPRTANSFGFVA